MNIKEFKVGDIITRNEPCKYEHNQVKDGSWLGDKMKLAGYSEEAKFFTLEHLEGHFTGDITKMSFARDSWDEGWCKYPENIAERKSGKVKITFLQRIKKLFNPK